MSIEKRIVKTQAKIEARKENQRVNGVVTPTSKEYERHQSYASFFRWVLSQKLPKSECIVLGETQREDIKRITGESPVIYAPQHSTTYDLARDIAYVVPHAYALVGDEYTNYYTFIDPLLKFFNGRIPFDRKDAEDCQYMKEISTTILNDGYDLLLYPEGTMNFNRGVLTLYLTIIELALNSGAIIAPIGKEMHILRNKKGEVSGDISYSKYEDYHKDQTLFRPSDNIDLVRMYNHFKQIGYLEAVSNYDIDNYITANKFILGTFTLNLEDELAEFLYTHPQLLNFFVQLNKSGNTELIGRVERYLKRCTIIKSLRKMEVACLNILQERMGILSNQIITEIDKRHPLSPEQIMKNYEDYQKYFIDTHEKISRKGRSDIYTIVDQFRNEITEEEIIERETTKVLKGLKEVIQDDMVFDKYKISSMILK